MNASLQLKTQELIADYKAEAARYEKLARDLSAILGEGINSAKSRIENPEPGLFVVHPPVLPDDIVGRSHRRTAGGRDRAVRADRVFRARDWPYCVFPAVAVPRV